MSSPLSTPYDPYGKNNFNYSPVVTNTLPVLISTHDPSRPVIRLWKQQLLAVLAGTLVLALGALGLAAALGRGPLYDAFIDVTTYRGTIINSVNVGVLVGGIATLLSAVARYVVGGVARAWLRRRAVEARGISIAQWTTLAAGISIREAVRTPAISGGAILVFTLAMAFQGAALAGVALPGPIQRVTTGQMTGVVPLLGNAEKGQIRSCVSITSECAQREYLLHIGSALRTYWTAPTGNAIYSIGYGDMTSSGSFLAGVTPNITLTDYNEIYQVSPVTSMSTTCTLIDDIGAQSGRFYYSSACLTNQRRFFGNASADSTGTYIASTVCRGAGNTATLELAVGGYEYGPGRLTLPSRTFAVRCQLSGSEGLGEVRYSQRITASSIGLGSRSTTPLSSDDMYYLGTAVLAAAGLDSALEGVTGPIQYGLMRTVANGRVDTRRIASGISNGMAASASAAYMTLMFTSADARNGYVDMFAPLGTRLLKDGFGWAPNPRLLAWSVVCMLIGSVWLVLALYMIGGGTRYDPTDWFQTVNTAAGSNVQQIPGTCTGAHLSGSKINDGLLWYGELRPGHIGLSQRETVKLEPTNKYGGATV